MGESAGYGYESETGTGYGEPGGTYRMGGTSRTTTSHDVPIVIEGVIYLFNPPNIAELGKEGAPELVSGQSIAPLEPPAAPEEGQTTGEPVASQPAEGAPAQGQPAAGGPSTQPAPSGAAPTAPLPPAGQPAGTPAPPAGTAPPGAGAPPAEPNNPPATAPSGNQPSQPGMGNP